MAFLGDFGKFISHEVKQLAPLRQAASPIAKLPIIGPLLGTLAHATGYREPPKNTNVSQSSLPQYFGQSPYAGNPNFAPTYYAPTYGAAGGDPYGFQAPYNPYNPYAGGGPQPWAYSTMYSQPSTQQYQVSSAAPDRTWEDLVSIALPFFL